MTDKKLKQKMSCTICFNSLHFSSRIFFFSRWSNPNATISGTEVVSTWLFPIFLFFSILKSLYCFWYGDNCLTALNLGWHEIKWLELYTGATFLFWWCRWKVMRCNMVVCIILVLTWLWITKILYLTHFCFLLHMGYIRLMC